MKILRNMDKRSRFVVCATLLLLSLLLIGAGRITGEFNGRSVSKQMEKEHWTRLVAGMSSQLPRENREAWLKSASENPQALLKLSTIEFKCASNGSL